MDLNHLDWLLGGFALLILLGGLVMLLTGVKSLNQRSPD